MAGGAASVPCARDRLRASRRRRLPVDREPGSVWSLWLDDRARALELAGTAPGFAFAAEPKRFR